MFNKHRNTCYPVGCYILYHCGHSAFKQGEFWLDKVRRNSCSDNQGNEECLRWEEARNSLTFFSPERQRLTVDTIDSGRSGRDKSRMEKSYNSKWQCWHNIVSTNSTYLNLGWKLEVSIHQTRLKLLSHGISGSKNKWINQPGEKLLNIYVNGTVAFSNKIDPGFIRWKCLSQSKVTLFVN